MFQIDKFEMIMNGPDQAGIRVSFMSGEVVEVLFADIPETRTTKEQKAAWLQDRLNELMTTPSGQRHYTAKVVGLQDSPLKVAVSIEAT